MLHRLFGFSGRIARLGYFGHLMLAYAIAAGLCMLALMGAYGAFGQPDQHLVVDGALFGLWVVLLAVCAWAVVALMVKRLHDMGWSGVHVFWIILAGGAAIVFSESRSGLGSGLSVVTLGLLLLLLVAPGTRDPNAFGPPPGA